MKKYTISAQYLINYACLKKNTVTWGVDIIIVSKLPSIFCDPELHDHFHDFDFSEDIVSKHMSSIFYSVLYQLTSRWRPANLINFMLYILSRICSIVFRTFLPNNQEMTYIYIFPNIHTHNYHNQFALLYLQLFTQFYCF